MKLVEAADAAGLNSYHLAEHHGTPLGMGLRQELFSITKLWHAHDDHSAFTESAARLP